MARRPQNSRPWISGQNPLPYGTGPTTVLAIGNSQKFIEQISGVLASQQRIRFAGGAQGRVEAAERLVLLKPDVVVIDINLDYELGGIDTSFALRRISPSVAFVLISPYSDAERLSMVPRGLGLEWSYLLCEDGLDAADLVSAISSASWSIPFIDRRIDRSRLGKLQDEVAKAVDIVLETTKRSRRRNSPPGYSPSSDWNGMVQRFKLAEDDSGDNSGNGA